MGVALVTLVPIINPMSTAVLLLGISSHHSVKERNRQIFRACLYMTAILVVFLLAGHFVMLAFGISIPGIRIAGGLIIGFLGFRMLFPDDGPITGKGREEAQQKRGISFSPLAMPSGISSRLHRHSVCNQWCTGSRAACGLLETIETINCTLIVVGAMLQLGETFISARFSGTEPPCRCMFRVVELENMR